MHIYYRACSQGNPHKLRPIQDKYLLVKACFESMLMAFKDTEHTLVILLDKPTVLFRSLFAGFTVEETYYGDFTEGNIGSFHRQIELGVQDDFLFVEDDYYFLPDTGPKILQAIQELDGFVTPYDHPSWYTEEIHKYQRTVKLIGDHHWASIASTTLTFGGKKEYLLQEANTMKKYGWADHPMWLDITNRVPLYAPIPTLATHMETPYLAPSVNWEEQLKT